MLVKRIGRFLNKGFKIFKGERGTQATSREGVLTLMYAWNSAPIPLTNISRSMVVTGRKFLFPIDFSADKAIWLTGTKRWAESYAANQARLLLHSREIASLIIVETQSFHRERMNDLRPDPTQYAIGDKVRAHRSVRSDKAKNRVDKTEFAYTGPWESMRKLDGASYKIKHCRTNRIDKRHAMHLSPLPPELTAFRALDGADSRYGQLYKGITDDEYKCAGIDDFLPHDPLKDFKFNPAAARAAKITSDASRDTMPAMPTLFKLNQELLNSKGWSSEEIESAMQSRSRSPSPILQPTSMPATKPAPRMPPSVSELHAQLCSSIAKLFFICWRHEWRLVCCAYKDTLAVNPDCITKGCFLVDFFMPHPEDANHSAPNQRFWLQFHKKPGPLYFTLKIFYHLVRPTGNSTLYARNKDLVPYRQWAYLSRADTFIHGPIDFQFTAHGNKSRDRISRANWSVLRDNNHLYKNKAPVFKARDLLSIHCTLFATQEYYYDNIDETLLAMPLLKAEHYSPDPPPV